MNDPRPLSDPCARGGVDAMVIRTLRALGGEATLGDLFVLTGLSTTDIEQAMARLMVTGAGGVRVSSAGDMTYHLEDVSSGLRSPTPPCTKLVQRRRDLGLDFEPMIGFDYKTLTLIRARQGVLSLAELVEHTGFSVSDAEINLFNSETFPLMKPEAVIINCGRGDLIDEADLVEALDKGLLAAAILDVMQTEPLAVNSPMWRHPKIVLTPHVSGWHLGDAVNDIAENLRRLDSGEPLLHLVNREIGY